MGRRSKDEKFMRRGWKGDAMLPPKPRKPPLPPPDIEAIRVQLKPCPFCGSPPYVGDDTLKSTEPRIWVICENQACRISLEVAGPDIQQIIDAWNRRIETG